MSLALVVAGPAAALRPFDGTDADVAARHVVEIEAGPIGYFAQGNDRVLSGPALVFNYGAAANTEVVVQGQFERAIGAYEGEHRNSVTGLSATVKQVLHKGVLQDASGPSFAVEYGVLFPDIHGDHDVGGTLAGIVSERWNGVDVHVNAVTSLTRTHHLDLFGSIIAEAPEAWLIRPVAEAYIEREDGQSRTLSGLLGLLWASSEKLQFDVGFRLARQNDQVVREYRAGFTWSFE